MSKTELPPPPPAAAWPPPGLQPYTPPASYAQPAPQPVMYVKSATNGLAITGFVTALLGFLCGFVPLIGFLGAFFWGIFGAVFSILGVRKAKRMRDAAVQAGPQGTGSHHRGLAVAGLVFAALAFIMGGVNIAATDAAVKEVDKAVADLDRELDEAGAQWDEYTSCMNGLDIMSDSYSADSERCSAILD